MVPDQAPEPSPVTRPRSAVVRGVTERDRTRPLALVVVLVVALAVPLGVTSALLWSRAGQISGTAQAERDGVTYLLPLVRLLAAASDQQSLAVAGTAGNGVALRSAIKDMDAVDDSLGVRLKAHDRWVNLRQRLQALADAPPTPGSAYRSFAPVVDQTIALIGVVGDSSTLILDPELDTYYLMDITLLRLPAILVSAGRLSDRGRTPAAVAGPEAAVLADQIRQQSSALDTSVRKSFAATRDDAVTTRLIGQLDQFNDAVTSIAPPSAGVGGVTDSGDSLLADRNRLRDAALALEEGALTQLDLLLRSRQEAADSQRLLIVGLLAAGLLLATPAVWLLGSRSSPRSGPGARGPERTTSAPLGDGAGLQPSAVARAASWPGTDSGAGR